MRQINHFKLNKTNFYLVGVFNCKQIDVLIFLLVEVDITKTIVKDVIRYGLFINYK